MAGVAAHHNRPPWYRRWHHPGYGGSLADASRVGRSGDGGIDGINREDRLGLDMVYVQAKRWTGTVPIAEVRAFSGSLDDDKARRGVFTTTSGFPREAER
jgi:restriction system protein